MSWPQITEKEYGFSSQLDLPISGRFILWNSKFYRKHENLCASNSHSAGLGFLHRWRAALNSELRTPAGNAMSPPVIGGVLCEASWLVLSCFRQSCFGARVDSRKLEMSRLWWCPVYELSGQWRACRSQRQIFHPPCKASPQRAQKMTELEKFVPSPCIHCSCRTVLLTIEILRGSWQTVLQTIENLDPTQPNPRSRTPSSTTKSKRVKHIKGFTKQNPCDILLLQEIHHGLGKTSSQWTSGGWHVITSVHAEKRFQGVAVFINANLIGALDPRHQVC